MKIKSIIVDCCPSCKVPSITSNFAILAIRDEIPKIHLMFHCEMCHKKFQGSLDSEDFLLISE